MQIYNKNTIDVKEREIYKKIEEFSGNVILKNNNLNFTAWELSAKGITLLPKYDTNNNIIFISNGKICTGIETSGSGETLQIFYHTILGKTLVYDRNGWKEGQVVSGSPTRMSEWQRLFILNTTNITVADITKVYNWLKNNGEQIK